MQYYQPVVNGVYIVEVRDINGCPAVSLSFNFITAEIGKVNNPAILIYPNPAKNYFTINSEEKILRYCLRDLVGKIVICKNAEENFITQEVNDFAPGEYFLQIETMSGIYNKRLLIFESR